MLRLRARRSWMMNLNIRRRLREVALRLDEARLKTDNVVAELIVFCLNSLKTFTQTAVVLHLSFKMLDVAFLPLSERTL